MKDQAVDLFGEVIVTTEDVRTWLLCVPRMDPDSPRAAHYVRSYSVVDKIRWSKLTGHWETLKPPEIPSGTAGRLPWLFRPC